jgi:hypothetical protein
MKCISSTDGKTLLIHFNADFIKATHLARMGAKIYARDNSGKSAFDYNTHNYGLFGELQRDTWPNFMLDDSASWYSEDDSSCTIDVPLSESYQRSIDFHMKRLLKIGNLLKFDPVGYFLYTMPLHDFSHSTADCFDVLCAMLKEFHQSRRDEAVQPMFHALLYNVMLNNRQFSHEKIDIDWHWVVEEGYLLKFFPRCLQKLLGDFYFLISNFSASKNNT